MMMSAIIARRLVTGPMSVRRVPVIVVDVVVDPVVDMIVEGMVVTVTKAEEEEDLTQAPVVEVVADTGKEEEAGEAETEAGAEAEATTEETAVVTAEEIDIETTKKTKEAEKVLLTTLLNPSPDPVPDPTSGPFYPIVVIFLVLLTEPASLRTLKELESNLNPEVGLGEDLLARNPTAARVLWISEPLGDQSRAS